MAPGRSLRVALLFAALAALFAMHGLGGHAAAHPAEPAHHAVLMAVDSALPTVVGIGDHGVPGAAVVCFAVLVGTSLGLALLLARRHSPGVLLPRAALLPAPSPHSRSPDPPTPASLSVCRC